MTLVNEFKAFILRGNVMDLAVGVIIGAAFGIALDTSFTIRKITKAISTKLITLVRNEPYPNSATPAAFNAT